MTIDWSNTEDPHLIPTYLKKFHLAQIDEFDNEWLPMMLRAMPKRESPGLAQGGSGREFSTPWIADPQAMARYHDARERVEPMASPHVEAITHWCRTIKNAYIEDMEEFEGDFANGVIQSKRKMLDKNLIRNINRTIEYTLTRFVYGDPVVMASFTTQGLARQGNANVAAGTFRGAADANLGGQHWGVAAANIFSDLNYLKDRYELMAGELPEFLMIGRVTTRNLENNNNLLNRLIQIKDTTQGVLGSAIQGLKIVRVVGQTYKDIPGLGNVVDTPGKGDYLRQTWARLNKVEMMTQQMGAQRWEWGLITNGDMGYTACAWVHRLHQKQRSSPTQFSVREFIENHDHLDVKSIAEIAISPVVTDFAKAMRIDRTSPQ